MVIRRQTFPAMVGGREGVDEEVQDIFIELDSILFVVFIDKEEEVE